VGGVEQEIKPCRRERNQHRLKDESELTSYLRAAAPDVPKLSPALDRSAVGRLWKEFEHLTHLRLSGLWR